MELPSHPTTAESVTVSALSKRGSRKHYDGENGKGGGECWFHGALLVNGSVPPKFD